MGMFNQYIIMSCYIIILLLNFQADILAGAPTCKFVNENTICTELQEEIKVVARGDTNSILRRNGFYGMSNLKFAEIVEEMRRLCPTMYKILAATLDVEEDQEHGNVILTDNVQTFQTIKFDTTS